MNQQTLSKKLFSSVEVAVYSAIRQKKDLQMSKSFKTPLPNDCLARLKKFIDDTSAAIDQGTFRPTKYTDPRGSRRFTLLPVYSFQMRHITLDNQALSHLLFKTGIKKTATLLSNDAARQAYFEFFDMAKIGYPTLDSLQSERCMFWYVFFFASPLLMFHPRHSNRDKIRTDGTDVEFMFKKAKRPKPPPPLTPAAVKGCLKNATVWGVDPGVTDLFVAADGSSDEPHRVRSISAREYYALCGYSRATQKRKEFLDHKDDAQTKKLIDGIPSLKTVHLTAYITSVQYRFQHHRTICEFYDRNCR